MSMNTTTLAINTREFLKDGITTVAHSDQKHFFYNVNPSVEKGLKMMLEGLEIYCESHKADNGTVAGQDGYLSSYLQEISHGIRGLFSGPGRFDGGTLDKTLLTVTERSELSVE